MRRKIIYSIYRMLYDFAGCVFICTLCVILNIPVIRLIQFTGCNELFAASIWFVGCMSICIYILRTGPKIEYERNLFENWRNILTSEDESKENKEVAAWNMLRSDDLTKKSLHEILYHFNPNTEINDVALDRLHGVKQSTKKFHDKKTKTPDNL